MNITKANIASFSREYIKSLLEEELKKCGFEPKGRWHFKTSYKYVFDGCGYGHMDSQIVTTFNGVSVAVEEIERSGE